MNKDVYVPVYRVIFIVMSVLLDNLYSGALQIIDCIVLYCIVSYEHWLTFDSLTQIAIYALIFAQLLFAKTVHKVTDHYKLDFK